jgi:hypothetical protein
MQSCASSSLSSSSSDSTSDLSDVATAIPITIRTRVRKTIADSKSKCDAPWQVMLDDDAAGRNTISKEETRDGMYFRRRFRVPYLLFKALMTCILEERWFSGYEDCGRGKLDATRDERRRGASLQVKILSVFRILGRGNVFDECFDGSGCSESLIAAFFHDFLSRFVGRLFICCVCPPADSIELGEQMKIYQRLGLSGACGSTDVTHIGLGKCPRNWQNSCTGKSGKPTLAYSVTCSHSRKIFYCSPGFEG